MPRRRTKKNVLMLTNFFYPHIGGIENNAYHVAKGLVKRGYNVTVLCSGNEKEDNIDGIKIVRAPLKAKVSNAAVSPSIPILLLKELRKQPDMLYVHMPNPFTNAWLAIISYFKKLPPMIVMYHSDILKKHPFTRALKKVYTSPLFQGKLLRKAEVIFATSPNYVKLSDILYKYTYKVRIVPNGIDLSEFKPGSSTQKFREKHGLTKKDKVILFTGRLIPYKGVQYLIKALPKVIKKVPEVKLLIVGEGPEKENWRRLAEEEGVSDRVIWAGKLSWSDLKKAYAACDVFVLPSVMKTEAFGIVLLEAMAMGKPVITTTISGTEYVVRGAGIAVPPKDSDSLANAIIQVLSNKNKAKKMSVKSSQKVKEFEWNKIIEMIDAIITKIPASKSS